MLQGDGRLDQKMPSSMPDRCLLSMKGSVSYWRIGQLSLTYFAESFT